MQISLLLPLILIATNGPTVPAEHSISVKPYPGQHYVAQNVAGQAFSVRIPARRDTHVTAIFDGCRPPVLDTREASKILFEKRVDGLDATLRSDLPDTGDNPLFISRCGSEFVLFHRAAPDHSGDILYLRFEEGSFELLDEAWG